MSFFMHTNVFKIEVLTVKIPVLFSHLFFFFIPQPVHCKTFNETLPQFLEFPIWGKGLISFLSL